MSEPQTYTALQASLLAWLDNTSANVDPAECIGLAERRLTRLLNVPDMETTTTLTSGVSSTALPADFWEVRSLVLSDSPNVPLEQLSVAELTSQYRSNVVGAPRSYAVRGLTILLGPTPTTPASLTLTYKATIPALTVTNTTNWLLTKHPDLYIAASLCMAELRGWNDARIPLIKAWYDELIGEVNMTGQRARYGGGPIRARANTSA